MPGALRLDLRLTIGGVAEAQAAMRDFLAGSGIVARVIGRAELVLEEVLMNVLLHGGTAPEARVVVSVQLGDGGCQLEVEDEGRPFDPTLVTPSVLNTSLEEAPIGGLGLILVRRFARNIAYQRLADGRNRLRLTVPLTQEP